MTKNKTTWNIDKDALITLVIVVISLIFLLGWVKADNIKLQQENENLQKLINQMIDEDYDYNTYIPCQPELRFYQGDINDLNWHCKENIAWLETSKFMDNESITVYYSSIISENKEGRLVENWGFRRIMPYAKK